MKQLAEIFFHRGEKLSLRLLFWILLLSSVLALMATTVQLYTDYRESRQSLEHSIQEVQTTILPAVAVAMWKLDLEVMESILTGLLTQKGFLYAEVIDTYSNPVIQLGSLDSPNKFERHYPIMFTNDVGQQIMIGKLKITATLAEIYRQMMDKIVIILLTQGVKTFFMSICILLLVERMVIRHLNTLASWANSVDLANPEQYLNLPYRRASNGDAIDKVHIAINTMQSNLIQALSERERAERLIRSIIDNSPSLIYAKDKQGRYTMVNQKYLSTLRLSQEQVLGHTAADLFSEEVAGKLQQHDSIVAACGRPVTFDEELNPEDPSEYYISEKFPIYDELGNQVGTGGVSTNITDRRNKEQEILDLNESLEQKVHQRTSELEVSLSSLKEAQNQLIESEKMSALGNLVAGVAHEINTPLGVSITAASHLDEMLLQFEKEYESGQLQREDVEDLILNSKESTKILQHNLYRATELIKNFKQVAVDQSSEALRSFELGNYLEETSQSLKPQLKKGGHSIAILHANPVQVNSYPGAIAQVMTNLIMNSVIHGFKDKQAGEIRISISEMDGQACIDYQDDGIGLTAIQQEKVFEPFYTTNRGRGGSGLGMSISYNLIASKLAGSITCIDSSGGAHFVVRFPLDVEEIKRESNS